VKSFAVVEVRVVTASTLSNRFAALYSHLQRRSHVYRCGKHGRYAIVTVVSVPMSSPPSSRRSSSARRWHVAVQCGRGVAAIDARPTSSLQSVVIVGQSRPDRWQPSLSVPCVHLAAAIRAATLVAEPPIDDRPHHRRSRLSASRLRFHKALNVNTQDDRRC
jgi:hypothetical protein